MEIYRQKINRVWFKVPTESANFNVAVTAMVSLNGGTSTSLTVYPLNPTDHNRWIDVPYINDEGSLRVEWTWPGTQLTFDGTVSEFNKQVDTYEVVTPILSASEIKEIHPLATESETVAIEKAVRHVINAHTGQRFGRFSGVQKVNGNGSEALSLPGRLLELRTVNGEAGNLRYLVDGDGWILRFYPLGVPPVKADYYGFHMHVGGVIHNPNDVKYGILGRDRIYEIDGLWGWNEVPTQVTEAAKLLVNDYACADAQYRDRYLTSMTAADWRIQFNSGAFAQTGNVRADQLLAEFVMQRGWAIL